MLGQRTAKRLRGNRVLCRGDSLQLFDGAGNLQVFELELKLLDLAEHLLALGAEKHPLQLLDQQRKPFDLARPRAEGRGIALMLGLEVVLLREDHRLQRCGIEGVQIRQTEGSEHVRSMS